MKTKTEINEEKAAMDVLKSFLIIPGLFCGGVFGGMLFTTNYKSIGELIAFVIIGILTTIFLGIGIPAEGRLSAKAKQDEKQEIR